MQSTCRTLLAASFVWLTVSTGLMTPASAAISYEEYLKCPLSDAIKDVDAAIAWWDRRSPLEQKLIAALPCDERFVPIVCVFLYNPDLTKCTNDGLAEYHANKTCQAKGIDLLSQDMSDCKEKYKKTYKPPFGATS